MFWFKQATNNAQQSRSLLQHGKNNNNHVVQPKYTASARDDKHNTKTTTRLNKVNVLTCGIGAAKQTSELFTLKGRNARCDQTEKNQQIPQL